MKVAEVVETATPHPKTCDHPCPNTLESAPLHFLTGGAGFHLQTVTYSSEDGRRAGAMTACLDYGLPGRGAKAPQREGAFSSVCSALTWTVTCQGSATLETHGQVPGFREPPAFLHMVKTSTAPALAWQLRLDSRGGEKHDVQRHTLTLTHSLHRCHYAQRH